MPPSAWASAACNAQGDGGLRLSHSGGQCRRQLHQPLLDASDLQDCTLPADALAKLPVGEYQWRVASIRTLSNGQLDAGPFAAPQKIERPRAPKSLDLQLDGSAGEGSRSIRWAGEEGQRYHIVVASFLNSEYLLLNKAIAFNLSSFIISDKSTFEAFVLKIKS